MNDTPPPKRRFWQIHLSTVMVLTVVAGLLLYLNLRPASDKYERHYSVYGWPNSVVAYNNLSHVWYFVKGTPQRTYDTDWSTWGEAEGVSIRAAANTIAALAILLLTAMASEYLIRRRSKP